MDNFPDQQVMATGSSSFELVNEVVEPLTGRNIPFWLYPFSLQELTFIWDRMTNPDERAARYLVCHPRL
ncbi:MAG: AAA family ATPase [Candidatus Roizmanbacteria bacterium]|nr:AAA family ATPase [Candidatus Roizmanbacteria bacterium]